jgi:hypothetical protein
MLITARAPTRTQLDRGISGAAVLLHVGQSFGDHEMGSILRRIRQLDAIDLTEVGWCLGRARHEGRERHREHSHDRSEVATGALDHGRHEIILCLCPASVGRASSAETTGPAKLELRIAALWQNVIKIKYFIGRLIAAARITHIRYVPRFGLLPPSGDRASSRSGYPYLIGFLWACV